LGELATDVVTQTEVAKRDAIHVFGGNDGRVETVEHNVLGRRETTRPLVAVVTIATTGTLVTVIAKTSGARTVITVATEGAVALGTVRARTIGSWTVVAAEPRGAALITAALVTIGASCGAPVFAVIA
jgi:NADH dehydrogenase/NADH:ubiquinone oxidoreductase subunit G